LTNQQSGAYQMTTFDVVHIINSHVTWVWDAYRGTIKHLLTTIT
jgi:hypothetical protein